MPDPVDRLLEGLGRLRGNARAEMTRLPIPDPFKKILAEVDTILSKAEEDIRVTKKSIPPRLSGFR